MKQQWNNFQGVDFVYVVVREEWLDVAKSVYSQCLLLGANGERYFEMDESCAV